jgi:hypothetical protein
LLSDPRGANTIHLLRSGGILSSIDDQQLALSPAWGSSGFADLEAFLLGFLVGSEPGKASESVRLKLQTPLSIADALLGASEQQLKGDLASAEKVRWGAALVAIQSLLPAISGINVL